MDIKILFNKQTSKPNSAERRIRIAYIFWLCRKKMIWQINFARSRTIRTEPGLNVTKDKKNIIPLSYFLYFAAIVSLYWYEHDYIVTISVKYIYTTIILVCIGLKVTWFVQSFVATKKLCQWPTKVSFP